MDKLIGWLGRSSYTSDNYLSFLPAFSPMGFFQEFGVTRVSLESPRSTETTDGSCKLISPPTLLIGFRVLSGAPGTLQVT